MTYYTTKVVMLSPIWQQFTSHLQKFRSCLNNWTGCKILSIKLFWYSMDTSAYLFMSHNHEVLRIIKDWSRYLFTKAHFSISYWIVRFPLINSYFREEIDNSLLEVRYVRKEKLSIVLFLSYERHFNNLQAKLSQ